MTYAKIPLYFRGKPFWVSTALAEEKGLRYGDEIPTPEKFWEIFDETSAEMIRQSEKELQKNEQPPAGLYPDPARFKKA